MVILDLKHKMIKKSMISTSGEYSELIAYDACLKSFASKAYVCIHTVLNCQRKQQNIKTL